MSPKSFFSLFSQKNNAIQKEKINSTRILTDSKELKGLITEWMENEGWKFEYFADFLELIGLKLPVKLRYLNSKTNTFECITADNIIFEIRLRFGDAFDWCSEIYIAKGSQEVHYSINSNIPTRIVLPKVTLNSRVITAPMKKLVCLYSEYSCSRTLTLLDEFVLKIDIGEPETYNEKKERLILKNSDAIENYLLNLTHPINVQQVYDTILELLSFSDEDLKNCEKFSISYSKLLSHYQVLDQILIKNGQKS